MHACLQPIAGKGCFAVAMIADFDRTLQEDGAFAYRRLHWEAGAHRPGALSLGDAPSASPAPALAASSTTRSTRCWACRRSNTQFQDVYHFTVGAALEDPRMLTLPRLS